MHELERMLQHVLRTSQAPLSSTPKGPAGLNATLPLSGLAPPADDSFKVHVLSTRRIQWACIAAARHGMAMMCR